MSSTDPSSGQALPGGTCLEEFVVERVLGSGGFGITYLARDTQLERRVVIKENLPVEFAFRDTRSLTVHPRSATGEDVENFGWALENFAREAAMLASLDHPGIVRVLRSFEALGTAFFVMPFVEGMAFDGLIEERRRQDKPFAADEVSGLLGHLLDALAYLHERGIYHRDVKPANILVANDGVPVLIDFGSARQRIGERSMTVVESAGYTPFEQLQSRGKVGPWSDLYALGGTMLKAITFESLPKAADRAFDDPFEALSARQDLRARYPDALLGSIDRALAVQVGDRYQSAEKWKDALGAGGSTVAGSRPDAGAGEAPPVAPAAAAPAQDLEASRGGPEPGRELRWSVDRRQTKAGVGGRLMLAAGVLTLVVLGTWVLVLGIAAKKRGQAVAAAWGLFERGEELPPDFFERVDRTQLLEAAERGDARAQFIWGRLHDSGLGLLDNDAEAASWYRKAAEQGHAKAQFSLGLMCEKGQGVARSKREALLWYRKAADQGIVVAQRRLAWLYAEGLGVDRNEEEAVKWYRKAADAGDGEAMWCLGLCYSTGSGVAADPKAAIEWLQKAVERGYEPAAADLERMVNRESADAGDSSGTLSGFPYATPVPGKPGHVFSPYTNKVVKVEGISPGTLIYDPGVAESERKWYRVP